MTELTLIECDLTGRTARVRNFFEELTVVHASGKWEEPRSRTYHVHLEELLERDDVPETSAGSFDDHVFVHHYCYEDGEVVGAVGAPTKMVGSTGRGTGTTFVNREEFSAYQEYMANVIEELEHE